MKKIRKLDPTDFLESTIQIMRNVREKLISMHGKVIADSNSDFDQHTADTINLSKYIDIINNQISILQQEIPLDPNIQSLIDQYKYTITCRKMLRRKLLKHIVDNKAFLNPEMQRTIDKNSYPNLSDGFLFQYLDYIQHNKPKDNIHVI